MAKTIPFKIDKKSAFLATKLASSGFLAPRYLETKAFIPTLVPTATATINICTG